MISNMVAEPDFGDGASEDAITTKIGKVIGVFRFLVDQQKVMRNIMDGFDFQIDDVNNMTKEITNMTKLKMEAIEPELMKVGAV